MNKEMGQLVIDKIKKLPDDKLLELVSAHWHLFCEPVRQLVICLIPTCTCPKRFKCLDCNVCTCCIEDYYMLKAELWKEYGAGMNMLCLKCFSTRLGRELTPDDFKELEMNKPIIERLFHV